MRRAGVAAWAAVSLGWLAGCGESSRDQLEDQGSACLSPSGTQADLFFCGQAALAADSNLRVDIDFATCLSSSCDKLEHAGCEATRDGSVITVKARAIVLSSGNECTDDCGFATTSCELGPLPEGSYELRYGDSSITFDVPSTTAHRCAGSALHGSCCDTSADCAGGVCNPESNTCQG